jgi:hypothetical protein
MNWLAMMEMMQACNDGNDAVLLSQLCNLTILGWPLYATKSQYTDESMHQKHKVNLVLAVSSWIKTRDQATNPSNRATEPRMARTRSACQLHLALSRR